MKIPFVSIHRQRAEFTMMKFSKLYIDLIVDIEIKHDRDLDDPDNFNDSNDFDDSDDSGDSGDSESDDSQSSVSNTSVSEERSDRTPTFDFNI